MRFRIYRDALADEAIAATRYAEEAAMLCAALSDCACVRFAQPGYLNNQPVIWEESREKQPASESYDYAAETMTARILNIVTARRNA